jgi:glycosyltransferase involved in cell wall biosynthesis
MRVSVFIEGRFLRAPDGRVYQPIFPYSFWERYLEVFDEVRVVTRLFDTAEPQDPALRADGERVSFSPIPYYLRPAGYLRKLPAIRRAVARTVAESEAIVLRVPSPLTGLALPHLEKARHPFAVEVVADSWDLFAPGAVAHRLRPFFRLWYTEEQWRVCRRAAVAAYVTKHALQRRYPCGVRPIGAQPDEVFSTFYSSIRLDPGAFAPAPWDHPRSPPSLRLVSVGSLEQRYKAIDALIDACGRCLAEGIDVHLCIVGDGVHRAELEVQARRVAPADRIVFRGLLPRSEVVRELDAADLFVLPSRTEGLPRALIEAMARGLPCVASNIGGIPELLPPDDLFEPGDASAVARKVREMTRDPERLARMARRNLAAAREYEDQALRARRTSMYVHLRGLTEAWLRLPHRPS